MEQRVEASRGSEGDQPALNHTTAASAPRWALITLGLVGFIAAAANSPTIDEAYHLAFGARALDLGRVVRDQPWQDGLMPWSMVPALVAGITEDGPRDMGQLIVARWFSVAALVALAALLSAAARRITGNSTLALFAVLLLLMSPNLLAHGALATTDVPAALGWTAVLVGALVYLHTGARSWALIVVLGAALALWTKASSLLLLALLPLLLPWAARSQRALHSPTPPRAAMLGGAAVVVALLWSFVAPPSAPPSGGWAGSVAQANATLSASPDALPLLPTSGVAVPLPVPDHLALGVQLLRAHGLRGHDSYLLGEVTTHGRWYYFLALFVLKTPLVGWLTAVMLLGLAAVTRWRARRLSSRDILLLAVPALWLGIASLSTFQMGIRHMLVGVPALQLWCLLEAWERRGTLRRPGARAALLALLAVTAVEVHVSAPHYLSWFPAWLGGPTSAWQYVNDSNLDWGQEAGLMDAYVDPDGRVVQIRPPHPTVGLVALRANDLTSAATLEGRSEFGWALARDPVARVGATWFLFDVRPGDLDSADRDAP